jgi:signal peptidase I
LGPRDSSRREGDSSRRDVAARESDADAWFSVAAFREIVEALVVALILAFLFRTFEAEAFMIPTGSMATTLMGRHKDVVCSRCGCPYQINASHEIDANTNRARAFETVTGTCPNCRYPMDIGPHNPQHKDYPSYRGDRLIVAKYPYQFGDPSRWDVAVFLFPGGAKTPYIKRVVGLPEETIAIHQGNLFLKKTPDARPEILRKPPDKILATMQPVYDNDHLDPELAGKAWPLRWQPWPNAEADGKGLGWTASSDHKSFQIDGRTLKEAWIGYRNAVPTRSDWEFLSANGQAPPKRPLAQLISDFVAYNSENHVDQATARSLRRDRGLAAESIALGAPARNEVNGTHWVGDLVVECEANVQGDKGRLSLVLVKGGRIFQCNFDIASGGAELSIDGLESFHPKASTKLHGPGKYALRFANVDDQLVVWVNDRVVAFDSSTTYGPLDNGRPQEDDLTPVRIGAAGAAVKASHVRVLRDVYYVACRDTMMIDYENQSNPGYMHFEGVEGATPADRFAAFLARPSLWDAFDHLKSVEFKLDKDQFLMLGDNSPQSKDSRLWETDSYGPRIAYVDRHLLKGKAVFVYWPHSWDRVPGTAGWPFFPNGVPCPYFPNFARMRFVH